MLNKEQAADYCGVGLVTFETICRVRVIALGSGMIVRVKGIKRYRHPKTGIWYCYHRKSGVAIQAEFGSAKFFTELETLECAVKKAEPLPGTLGMVIAKYRSSPDWEALRPKTRLSYDRAFVVLKPCRTCRSLRSTALFVFELRDKILPKYGTWLANYTITALSLALGFATDRGWLDVNPLAQKIKKSKYPPAKPGALRF